MRNIQKLRYWGQEIYECVVKIQMVALRFVGRIIRKRILAERARFLQMLKEKDEFFEKKKKSKERKDKLKKLKIEREKEKNERF